jgi:hypothetical protein
MGNIKNMKFDTIFQNPPFQKPYQNNINKKGHGNSIWEKFIEISLLKLLNDNGMLCSLLQSNWRRCENKIGKLIKEKNVLYTQFTHPVIYTIRKNDVKVIWSKTNNKGYFGHKKIIWSNGAASRCLIDKDGTFGLSQFSFAILEDDHLGEMQDYLFSKQFLEISKAANFGPNAFDHTFISRLSKNFYKGETL